MSDPNGRFVWYELLTTDLAAAREFYTRAVGWQAMDAKMSGHDYWMFTAGGKPVTGLMTLPDDARKMGTPPNWVGYVGVADVDATAAKATANGGKVYVPPTDIPNVGRFSIVADPQGAALGLFKSSNPEEDQAPQPTEPGRVGWHELFANDGASAFDFYAALFGWEKKESMDMGEMGGVYQTFGIGDTTLGGMMNKPPEVPVANWHYYFNAGNIDEAAERVKAGGGQIVNGPMEVPGGSFILMGIDPQGAFFALIGSR